MDATTILLHVSTDMPQKAYFEDMGVNLSFHAYGIGRGLREDRMDTGWRCLPAPLIETTLRRALGAVAGGKTDAVDHRPRRGVRRSVWPRAQTGRALLRPR